MVVAGNDIAKSVLCSRMVQLSGSSLQGGSIAGIFMTS